ncbi:potassium channel family protein [Agitococcus lubricus]|uniref:Ion channel n=1 Tax=Agitococcus lubricus TaxID=1077255 RepID=A0A2T5J2U2_9GAMM|nr:potassium channel family protein [Agitococcus lubricus]PTQ90848.1 ion channel [Agitococcus lubricus]
MSIHSSFWLATLITGLLVFLTVSIHYEILRLISELIPKLKIQARLRILVVIYGAFIAHTLEVWLFGIAYYVLGAELGFGTFHGISTNHFFDFIYFSVVVYTSVGFGDIYPLGHMRLIAGVEALTGLLMIGWSASFTYLMMEKLWLDHRQSHHKKS